MSRRRPAARRLSPFALAVFAGALCVCLGGWALAGLILGKVLP